MVKAIKGTNLELFDMNECDDIDATVDGGDVLYTGFGSCDFFVILVQILVQILSPTRDIFLFVLGTEIKRRVVRWNFKKINC